MAEPPRAQRGGLFVSGIPTAAVGRAAVIAVVLSVLGVVLILILVLQHVLRVLAGRIGRVLVVVVDGLAAAFFAACQGAAAAEQPAATTADHVLERVAEHHAAGDAGRRTECAGEEAPACRRGCRGAPGTGLRRWRVAGGRWRVARRRLRRAGWCGPASLSAGRCGCGGGGGAAPPPNRLRPRLPRKLVSCAGADARVCASSSEIRWAAPSRACCCTNTVWARM